MSPSGCCAAEADIDLGLTANVRSEPPEGITAEEAQEDHLVAEQGQVMGDVATYAAGHQTYGTWVGVVRYEMIEGCRYDIGVSAANDTESHGISVCLLGTKLQNFLPKCFFFLKFLTFVH